MKTRRIWEIDAARGISLIFMVLYHLYYDLNYIFNFPFKMFGWFAPINLVFICISGISCTLNSSVRNNIKSLIPHGVKRGLSLILWGFCISVITFVLMPDSPVYFGILHFLGVSAIIYELFLKDKNINWLFIIAVVVFALSYTVKNINLPHLWILGIMDKQFSSVDYFPLIPYFSVFLIGTIIGKTVYPEKISRIPKIKILMPFAWLGTKSLIFYLIHQPVILLILSLLFAQK